MLFINTMKEISVFIYAKFISRWNVMKNISKFTNWLAIHRESELPQISKPAKIFKQAQAQISKQAHIRGVRQASLRGTEQKQTKQGVK